MSREVVWLMKSCVEGGLMADRRSTAHEVWIGEDEHVWLAADSWRVDVTQLKAQHDRYREALEEIARRLPVERNPDGVDQAAYSMQLIAREALGAVDPIAPGSPAPSPRKAGRG